METITRLDILFFIAKHWWLTIDQLQIITSKNRKNLYRQIDSLKKQGLVKMQAILNSQTKGISLTKKGMQLLGLNWKAETFRIYEYYHNNKIINLLCYLFKNKNIKVRPELYLTDRDIKKKFAIAKSITIPDLVIDGIYYEIENSQSSKRVFDKYFSDIEKQQDKDFIKEVQFWASEPVYSYLINHIEKNCLLPDTIKITFHNLNYY